MKLQLIIIGNSQGIRIPKAILKQCGFKGSVIAQVKDGNLILSAESNPREGWGESFKRMADNQDDVLLDAEHLDSALDEEDWEW